MSELREAWESLKIPETMYEYVNQRYACISKQFGGNDAINGYGRHEVICVKIEQYYERCVKCGYHSLFGMRMWDHSPCSRHKWETGYETTFVWTFDMTQLNDEDPSESLEKEWAQFLDRKGRYTTYPKF